MATLTFCGAAGTVTGSCSLVASDRGSFLVDCGLFQGNRSVRDLNFEPFPFDPKDVQFLLLTHAHIDHSGLIPKLVKAGFSGAIYATAPTADLLQFLLPDSAEIQRSNTDRLNRKRRGREQRWYEPLYEMEHAEQALKQIRPVEYARWFEPAPGIQARFWNAGHILGSASAEVKVAAADNGNTLRLLFSGDIGPDEKAFHADPDAPEGFDYVVCESTYGDRDRDDYTLEQRRNTLRDELKRGLERGGNIVIPAFAVERSQELLHDVGTLLSRKEIPDATVYLDSPLARRVTSVFIKYAGALKDVEVDEAKLFRHERFRLVHSVEESKAISRVRGGAIIISASGMCEAGRVKHHLRDNIWRPEATVLFVGYQAPGTLGHFISSGKKAVRIHGKEFVVRAAVRSIGNYSAHADQGELVDWVMERGPVAGRLFLNHGEDGARKAFRELLDGRGLASDKIVLPSLDESFELVAGTARSKGRVAQRIDDALLERDWHNDYAAFILQLTEKLETTTDRTKRRELIGRLQQQLES